MAGRVKRKKLGRPPLKAGRRERINMTLPPDVIEYLDRIGYGNRSEAVVQLVRARMVQDGEQS